MRSVHDVIEAFRPAPSNSQRGTRFERLMVRYFELDPMLSQQYDAVWRWIDWPGRDGEKRAFGLRAQPLGNEVVRLSEDKRGEQQSAVVVGNR